MPPFVAPPETPDSPAGLQQFIVPDLWQQQAVSALRAGKDVIIHAPTGAGKTLVLVERFVRDVLEGDGEGEFAMDVSVGVGDASVLLVDET